MVSLAGQNVGIIGFGSIGRETARLFKMMGCEISCFDLFPPDKKKQKKLEQQFVICHHYYHKVILYLFMFRNNRNKRPYFKI